MQLKVCVVTKMCMCKIYFSVFKITPPHVQDCPSYKYNILKLPPFSVTKYVNIISKLIIQNVALLFLYCMNVLNYLI